MARDITRVAVRSNSDARDKMRAANMLGLPARLLLRGQWTDPNDALDSDLNFDAGAPKIAKIEDAASCRFMCAVEGDIVYPEMTSRSRAYIELGDI